ncbi:MAG: sugar ABC transporter permease [Deltaproteobacteria bacterium]|nr:MAG: sugar ABC transporter permease [Deltaproteobacteria bacterium]
MFSKRVEENWLPYLLFLPTLIFLAVFVGYPLLEALKLAFTSESGRLSLDNFIALALDSTFWKALKYTLLFLVTIVPLDVLLAFLLALFVNRRFQGYMIVLYLISIPLALSDVSAALMSYNIFTSHGFLNKFLMKFGIIETPIYFFGIGLSSRAFWVIVLTELWRATPLVFVILLAGLQVISKDYLEAADVFGFSKWQKFFRITLPLVMPSLQSALLIRTLFAFQIFAVVWLLSGRDIPILAGETYYQQAELYHTEIAATYGFIIALICILISWAYITIFKSKHLEG